MITLLALIRFMPGVAFVVAIDEGVVKLHAPRKLPVGFVSAVQERIDRGELRSGVIYGKSQRGGLTLGFLRVPPLVHQPLLNSWHAHKQRYVA